MVTWQVRIQINKGHGGCYTMHTDAGTRFGAPGQTLRLTALFYLNEAWHEEDGGGSRLKNALTRATACDCMLPPSLSHHRPWACADVAGELRLFPYPRASVRIAPHGGRLVLFEPRMVHDVLPNFKRRYCFTLWCSNAGRASCAHTIDHATLRRMQVLPRVEERLPCQTAPVKSSRCL